MDHPLAHKSGIEIFMRLLIYQGGMCPKCMHGTRVTSKRWAKCKKCGERVQRRSLDDLEDSPPHTHSHTSEELK